MSRIRPLNDFVLLEKREPEKKSPGGTLHLPDKRNERARGHHEEHVDTIEARVVAVGPGDLGTQIDLANLGVGATTPSDPMFNRLMPVKEGDLILVCENALHEVSHEGRTLYLCPARALFATVEGN